MVKRSVMRKNRVVLMILIYVVSLVACAPKDSDMAETILEKENIAQGTEASATETHTVESEEISIPTPDISGQDMQTGWTMEDWVGYYIRRAETPDGGSLYMNFFIYEDAGNYYGYLNMDSFENKGDWAHTYPQARYLTEVCNEEGVIQIYFKEDFSENKQEDYFGSYEQGDLLFSLQREGTEIVPMWKELAVPEKEESKDTHFNFKEQCNLTLINQTDKEIFLKIHNIKIEAEPVYQYYAEETNELLQEVYYDEQSRSAVGLSYINLAEESYMIGYDITECEQREWKDNRDVLIREGEELPELENAEENKEYNENGQLICYEVTGIMTDLKEPDENDYTIVKIEFFYREDGTLWKKECYYNAWAFGTTGATEIYYYDEMERLTYAYIYITHGCLEEYYLYERDSKEPSYCLTVDHFGAGAVLLSCVKYE